MAKTFKEAKKHIIDDLTDQTVNVFNSLEKIWFETFDDDFCVIQAEQFSKQVKTFYDEIVAEAKIRQGITREENKHRRKSLSPNLKIKKSATKPTYPIKKRCSIPLPLRKGQNDRITTTGGIGGATRVKVNIKPSTLFIKPNSTTKTTAKTSATPNQTIGKVAKKFEKYSTPIGNRSPPVNRLFSSVSSPICM